MRDLHGAAGEAKAQRQILVQGPDPFIHAVRLATGRQPVQSSRDADPRVAAASCWKVPSRSAAMRTGGDNAVGSKSEGSQAGGTQSLRDLLAELGKRPHIRHDERSRSPVMPGELMRRRAMHSGRGIADSSPAFRAPVSSASGATALPSRAGTGCGPGCAMAVPACG